MTEFNAVDHTTPDVDFCGSPSDLPRLMRMIYRARARPVFVIDNGPEFASDRVRIALARLSKPKSTKDIGREHD